MTTPSDCEASGGIYHANGECSTPWIEAQTATPGDNDKVVVNEEGDLVIEKSGKAMSYFFTPVLIGSYAVAGLYIGRALTGSTGKLGLRTVGLVAGSSAVSAYVAPMLVKYITCPQSDSAPLYEAAISSAMSWQILMLTSGTESATRFIPVQLLAHVSGSYMSPKVKAWLKKMKSDKEPM